MVIENVSSPAASKRSSLRAQDLKLKISTHLIEIMTLLCLGVRASGRALFGSVCSRAGKTSWPSRWSQARHACSDGGREHAVSLKLQHKQYMFVFECLYRLEAAGSCGATQTQCSPDLTCYTARTRARKPSSNLHKPGNSAHAPASTSQHVRGHSDHLYVSLLCIVRVARPGSSHPVADKASPRTGQRNHHPTAWQSAAPSIRYCDTTLQRVRSRVGETSSW